MVSSCKLHCGEGARFWKAVQWSSIAQWCTLTLSYDNDGFIMDSLKMMTIDKTDEKNVFHAFLPFPKPAAYIIHNKIKPLETIYMMTCSLPLESLCLWFLFLCLVCFSSFSWNVIGSYCVGCGRQNWWQSLVAIAKHWTSVQHIKDINSFYLSIYLSK